VEGFDGVSDLEIEANGVESDERMYGWLFVPELS
jgi:hypothetical protein